MARALSNDEILAQTKDLVSLLGRNSGAPIPDRRKHEKMTNKTKTSKETQIIFFFTCIIGIKFSFKSKSLTITMVDD